jgi:RNA polymerase sigma-32 factor
MTTTALSQQSHLDRYLQEVRRHPVLTRDEELVLARKLKNEGDLQAAHTLVLSNLKFVVKIAHEYRKYGFKLLDLVQEGNIGLMVAVKKYDPEKGYRLLSYAVWWIRAYMQNYMMRSWSLVRMGASRVQRKLFFGLKSKQRALEQQGVASGDAVYEALAEHFGTDALEISETEARMAARDFSLDAQVVEGASKTHLEALPSAGANPEELYAEQEERALVRSKLASVMDTLNDKERYIVENRLLAEQDATLQDIGNTLHVSRERVRQLESRVVGKLKEAFGH